MSYLNNNQDEGEENSIGFFVYKYSFIILPLIAFIIITPLFTPAATFFWGLGSAKLFFRSEIGLSSSISEVFAVIFMFLYVILVPISLKWLLWWKNDLKNLLSAFISIFFIFASKPLIFAIFASNFSSLTGLSQKCYRRHEGQIVFFEQIDGKCSIDPATGRQTFPVTSEVAIAFERQKKPPREIGLNDLSKIEFFSAATGDARVWYEIAPDGTYHIFDSDGFSPKTGTNLRPVTKNVVERLLQDFDKKLTIRQDLENKYNIPNSLGSYEQSSGRINYPKVEKDLEFFSQTLSPGETEVRIPVKMNGYIVMYTITPQVPVTLGCWNHAYEPNASDKFSPCEAYSFGTWMSLELKEVQSEPVLIKWWYEKTEK
jgi:hypothetical protein